MKELVIIVGNKSISINTPFRFETIWIRGLGAPMGTILKNQMNLLITLVQAIGHKIFDLKTSSRILRKSSNKKMSSFWRKLIIGNLVCIKTCYNFKLAKPFQWPKTQVPRSWRPEITLIDASGHIDQKLPISRKYFWAIFFSGQKWYEQPQTKSQPFQNNPHMRKDASSWKAIHGMQRSPE